LRDHVDDGRLEFLDEFAEAPGVVEVGLVSLGLIGRNVRVTVLPSTRRVQERVGPVPVFGIGLAPTTRVLQRVVGSTRLPGRQKSSFAISAMI
jgi:hypothetical protein